MHGLPPIEGGISLTHMRWIRHARPAVYERTAAFLEPMDYVAMRFCGRAAANQCTAFMSLVTDNRRLNVTEYDARLLAQSGIDRDKLPPLVPLESILGTVLPDVATELPDLEEGEALSWDYELLGLSPDDHPMRLFRDRLRTRPQRERRPTWQWR